MTLKSDINSVILVCISVFVWKFSCVCLFVFLSVYVFVCVVCFFDCIFNYLLFTKTHKNYDIQTYNQLKQNKWIKNPINKQTLKVNSGQTLKLGLKEQVTKQTNKKTKQNTL